MIFSGSDSLSFEALQGGRKDNDDPDQMMYVQHPPLHHQHQHPHLHMQHQQQLPHLGLSYQHQDHMQDPFASSATNYTNYTSSHALNRFQHQRPNAVPASTAIHQHHPQHQQQQQQQLLHRAPYVSSAPGYYASYSQQMTPTTLNPVDPRDPGDRSAIIAAASSSSSASPSSSSSPSAPESSPLQWSKAQDYACAPAPTSAGNSLVFYGTGGHVTEWNGEFSCTKDALTSVGATNNACQQQQQQQQRQQLFSAVGAGDDDDDLNVGHRSLPLCLTGSSGGGTPPSVTAFLSHSTDMMRGVSTRHPIHSIAALQQGYPPPPSTHHHHLQPLGVSASLSQRSPQSQPAQVSLGPQQQGHSTSVEELRVMRGQTVGGTGGAGAGEGGGRMGNQNQTAPPFDWMKKQIYPTTPSSGKTRTKDKYRIVYSEHQKVELEKEFLYNPYITIQRKAELAAIIGLSDRQVKIWFQNRRAKERKQKKKRPQATTTTGVVTVAGTTAAPTVPPHQPSKTPRHYETTTHTASVTAPGGAQIYPTLQPPSTSGGNNRGCSAGPMKLESAAAAGVRALLATEGIEGLGLGCCGEVKSESLAPL